MAKNCNKIKNLAPLFIFLSILIGCGYSDIHETIGKFRVYIVSFESNSGSYVPSQTINSGNTATRPADPARSGYTFDGWYSDSELTKVYNFSTSVTVNITLYAKWNSVQTYTVSFDSNGGSYIEEKSVNSGSAVTRPTDPYKSGYTFDGWYGDSELETMYIFSTPVTGNITLYAKWYIVPTYTVSFNSNGGSYIEEKTVNSGGTVNRPTDPTKNGYTLVYWCSDSGLTMKYDFSTPVTGNITLYAKWESLSQTTCIVAFNSNDGSYVDTQIVNLGGTVNRPPNPTRNGHTFDNWYSNSGLTTKYDFSTPVTGNITLYAKWNIVQTYTVTFESNGGSYIATQTVNSGGAASRPTDPTRSGYTFDDWYSNSGLTTKYNFSMQVTGNITLYAKWNPIYVTQTPVAGDYNISGTGTFTYDGNAKVVTVTAKSGKSPGTVTVKYNGSITAPSAAGTYTVTFDVAEATGWNAASGLSAGTLVVNQNSPITYTVTFDKNGGDTEASPKTITVPPATAVGTLPTPPTRTGYTFAGWYTVAAATGGTQFTATTTVTDNIRVYARWTDITYGITLIPISIDFGTVTSPYTQPAAQTVTVTNKGNQATGPLEVKLSGTDASSFTLSGPSINSIPAGGTATFTVRPNPSLGADPYTATITVSNTDIPVTDENTVYVSFTVVKPQAEQPVASHSSGTYPDPINVTLSTNTPGATIYYTTNGSDPANEPRTRYQSAISLKTGTTTIKAIAEADGYLPSTIFVGTYFISPPPTVYTDTRTDIRYVSDSTSTSDSYNANLDLARLRDEGYRVVTISLDFQIQHITTGYVDIYILGNVLLLWDANVGNFDIGSKGNIKNFYWSISRSLDNFTNAFTVVWSASGQLADEYYLRTRTIRVTAYK